MELISADDFEGSGVGVVQARHMAEGLTFYAQTGSWKAVEAKYSRRTVYNWKAVPRFNELLYSKILPAAIAECEDTVWGIMRNGRTEDIRLKAAQYLLESHNANIYDAAIRRDKAKFQQARELLDHYKDKQIANDPFSSAIDITPVNAVSAITEGEG